MIVGIGIDIVEVDRIRKALQGTQSMEEKVFTGPEIQYCRQQKNLYQHFAGRFAAKEAALKALGTGWSQGIRWRDIETVKGNHGQPVLELHAKAKKIFETSEANLVLVSITHSSKQAIAVVVLDTGS